ncbi:FHA domain-containing protein [Pseudomonas soli]|jgi:type VI secretion system protein ImpI|uniref:FHA domain-containing protein n=1 Tax=Pseudomonas soli TaxID=1306993 RepID=A0A2V4HZA9_9PSED|nr:FHA domain-containing protein [Pseudomonas soli]PYB76160.1 hypothetical protein DMX07_22475 [Pseudomonas soli]
MNGLVLSIGNLEQLHHGVVASHRFNRHGGIIGSLKADWLLVDRQHRIHPLHCEIRWLEGGFCIIDHCGQTLLNDSPLPAGQQVPVRLRDGDCLQVGTYQLLVRCQVSPDAEVFTRRALDELFTPGRQALDALLESPSTSARQPHSTPPAPVDICTVFGPLEDQDLLTALNAPHRPVPVEENGLQRLMTGATP